MKENAQEFKVTGALQKDTAKGGIAVVNFCQVTLLIKSNQIQICK